MYAMILKNPKSPLVLEQVSKPIPKEGQLLVKINVCGVCRTDLHISQGDLPDPKLPLILGHEIVGIVESIGENVSEFKKGDRVGVPWLGNTCTHCEYCTEGKENLCVNAQFTGYTLNGGFAEYAVCQADYALHLPSGISDQHIAPLLCAGLIGYRSYKKSLAKESLGLYGFGASAHIVIQIALHQQKKVYVFIREGDTEGEKFAKNLGATWVGSSFALPPIPLDAAIIFAPVGELVPQSLQALKKGGRCICAGIHMSDIPSFPYKDLWGEKAIESVANLTREDGLEFINLMNEIHFQTHVTVYPLEKANQALYDLKNGNFKGAAVLQVS